MLDETKTSVAHERNSTKQPLNDSDVRAMLAKVDTVLVAKGRRTRTLTPAETKLDDLRGPTGGFRAPMVSKGRTLLVGFSEEELAKLIG